MITEEKITIGWNADSWMPRAMKHLCSGEAVLDDFSLDRLGILGEVMDLPLSHGVLHAYSCTAHLLQSERLRFSFLRMLTVWYYGLDLKKSGPYTVVWEDRLPDERAQKGYDALCKRLVELYEDEFPSMFLRNGQSSFRWMGHYPEFPKFLSFMRENEQGEDLLFLLNRGEEQIRDLDYGVPEQGDYEVLLDTSQMVYIGGQAEDAPAYGSKNLSVKNYDHCLFIDMEPASALILRKKTHTRDHQIEEVLKRIGS